MIRNRIEGKYIRAGIVAFIVIAASIVLFFAIFRAEGLMEALRSAGSIIAPFVYGLVVAYLLCPLYNVTYRGCRKVKFFKLGKKDYSRIIAKILASIVSLLALFGIIIGLLWMVIPGMIESITAIVRMMPGQINDLTIWVENTFHNMKDSSAPMAAFLDAVVLNAREWIENTMIPGSETIITSLSNVAFDIITGVWNFIIGIVICMFFLNSKEIFAAHSRKLVFAVVNEEKANRFLYGAHYVNRVFGKYINGKLIDSLVVGVVCFIVMSLFNWPYAMLISVIVGVTNIIPFFGPFIGAIPCILLIFIIDPIQSVYFALFVLVLQQFDGNILGPKILGDSTGLASFWVLFSILLFGGLFGFGGMVLGVPVFAMFYSAVSRLVRYGLGKRKLPQDTQDYLGKTEPLSQVHLPTEE